MFKVHTLETCFYGTSLWSNLAFKHVTDYEQWQQLYGVNECSNLPYSLKFLENFEEFCLASKILSYF